MIEDLQWQPSPHQTPSPLDSIEILLIHHPLVNKVLGNKTTGDPDTFKCETDSPIACPHKRWDKSNIPGIYSKHIIK